jgi:long-chain acyl-CoA synthetase
VNLTRPYPWERSYPPGVRWDAPLEIGTVPSILDGSAEIYGEKPAIEYRDRQISFAELAALSKRAAEGLRRLGVGHGTPLAVYLPNTPYHLITFFGALRLGAKIVHLSPLDAERELAYKLRDSGAKTLVTVNFPVMLPRALKLLQDGHAERLIVGDDARWGAPSIPLEPIGVSDKVFTYEALLANEPAGAFPNLSPDDIAVLQYTGGTTGTPKGAMLSHGNLSAAVSIYGAWQSGQGVEPAQDRVICVLPLFHIYALTSVMLRSIKSGNELMLRPRFDVETTLRDIEVKRATAFPGVPTMWIALNAVPGIEKRDLSSLKHC